MAVGAKRPVAVIQLKPVQLTATDSFPVKSTSDIQRADLPAQNVRATRMPGKSLSQTPDRELSTESVLWPTGVDDQSSSLVTLTRFNRQLFEVRHRNSTAGLRASTPQNVPLLMK